MRQNAPACPVEREAALCLDRGREGGVLGTRGAEQVCEAGEQNLPAERSVWCLLGEVWGKT